ncbi:MAG: serine hydrolase [Lewinellaceae bacterium]|nr:serine hydrolase [Lewinellaceae bacterium]
MYFPPLTGNTWTTQSPALLGWCTDEIPPLLSYLESNNTKAFIVLKDGKMVMEHYFGTFTQDSVWYWASAGKSMTAFLVGLAQQDGLLSLQDPTSQYLGAGWTSCSPAQEQNINIWNQLTMTTGLDDGVSDPYCTLNTCLQYLAEPGTRWAYHNGPYTVLDGVIEASTGQNLNTYFAQKVSVKTGISGIFLPSGYNNVLFSKPRSMARFGLLALNKGNWNGNQIMTDTAYFNAMVNTSQNMNLSYGYLWWLNGKPSFMVPGLQFVFPFPLSPNAPADMFSALGKNGQMVHVVPSQNLVVVRMGNAPDGSEVPIIFSDTMWVKLNAVICNTSPNASVVASLPELALRPNPAADFCQVRWPGQTFDVVLTDICGRQVLSQQGCSGETSLPVADLPKGLYLVQARNQQDRVITRKLVLHRP